MNGRESGAVTRLFIAHPRSLGLSWWEHGTGALRIGASLIGAGTACMVHALIPGWFTETAGRTVMRLHDHMQRRRVGAANPHDWPDYEI